MAKRKSTRNQTRIKKVLKKRGYAKGKLPKGKETHHVKPVSKGGKDTSKNIRVVSKTKHKKIHKNRKKRGKV